MGDKKIIKRVHITQPNMSLLKKQSEESNLTISEYLDQIVNQAIVYKSQEEKRKNPLYVWRT